MAEDELTQTGIRVGGWLPAVPAEPDREPRPPAVPRRLPAHPDAGVEPEAADAGQAGPESAGPPAEPARLPAAGSGAPAEPAGPPAEGNGPPPDAAPTGPPSTTTPPATAVGDTTARRWGADAGPEQGTSPLAASAPAGPVRHSARRSVAERLAGLVGPAAAKVRVAVGAAPEGPVTRVGVARARRRRRRVVLAGAATASALMLALALAYAGQGPRPGGAAAALPTPAASAPATAPPPTVVPVTGNPAFPGGPLLSVDQQPVPALVDLTVLGTRDWIHWGGLGGGSVQRKQTGTGEITDPGGARLEHAASVSAFAWTDGTPVARQEGTRYGVFQRGAGRSFALSVAGSDDLRTVRLFVGAFSAGARLDVRLSGGGDPAVREVALAAGDRFYEYVIHFRAARGTRLLITWRALTVVGGENDGVTMEAVTVS